MFEFPDSVESIDTVPADFRPLYAQNDTGTFGVPDALKPAVAAFKKVTGALTNSRKEADTFKRQVVDLAPLADFGQTVEEIKANFEAKLTEGSKAKVDIDKVKQAEAQRYANEIKQKDAKIASVTAQLYSLNVRNVAKDAIAAEKGSAELLMPHVERHVQQVEEDGQLKAYVIDADNSRRFSNVTGEPMTIRELVAEFKTNPVFAPAFASSAPKGGGTPPGVGVRTTSTVANGTTMSAEQKIAKGLEARNK